MTDEYEEFADALNLLVRRHKALGLGRFLCVLLIGGGSAVWYALNGSQEGSIGIFVVLLAISFVVAMIFNYQRARVKGEMFTLLEPLSPEERQWVAFVAQGRE